MRIGTLQVFRQGVNSILDQQSRLFETQNQLSTGKRINNPSDDPVGSAQLVGIVGTLSITQQYQLNIQQIEPRLQAEDATLGSVVDNLQRAREVVVQGLNDTNNLQDRGALSRELSQIVDQVLALANSKSTTGEYMFGGFQAQSIPFSTDGVGTFSYAGDQGRREVQIGPERRVADGDSGLDVFMKIPNATGTAVNGLPANTGSGVFQISSVDNTFTPLTAPLTFTYDAALQQYTDGISVIPYDPATDSGSTLAVGATGINIRLGGTPADGDQFVLGAKANEDVFSTLYQIETDMAAGIPLGASLAQIDNALEQMVGFQATIGARLNAMDNQTSINDSLRLQLEQTRSNIEDLDYAEAASRLSLQSVTLQAAQQAFVRVQNLNLFNFL